MSHSLSSSSHHPPSTSASAGPSPGSAASFKEPSATDTPPDMPGTPTSTTTSLSGISTIATKDGQRGHFGGSNALLGRGHAYSPSTTSLEAERAERISRLAGLERVSTLRAPPYGSYYNNGNNNANNNVNNSGSFTTTGSDASVPGGPGPDLSHLQQGSTVGNLPSLINGLAPVYFDAQGQPMARTKINTIGTPSATASIVSGDTQRTLDDLDESQSGCSTNIGALDCDSGGGGNPGDDSIASLNYTASSGDMLMLDENMSVSAQSVGGFDDRLSDDGAASLVGFGEGAGSTISGPIYQRRQLSSMTAGTLWGPGPSTGSVNGGDDMDSPGASTGRFGGGSASTSGGMLLHKRVDSSHSLGEMMSVSNRGATGSGGGGSNMTHAAVLEWTQQPAATRRFKSSREAAESILRERRERRSRGQHS
ncbi:hypothetical protein Cpir12675_001567 [Ceratocystis pirilliformis]|uniref:Uncharacterized protein n=1 Tax=Ceratocystis pirilliformis TaxID=259994 RepID=A0ABR3ZF07_9PEZI